MIWFLAVAFAAEPLHVESSIQSLGYGLDGTLWVHARRVVRYRDGTTSRPIDGRLLLADGRGSVITGLGHVLTVHDPTNPREVVLEERPTDLSRTADGGFVVRGLARLVRFDASGVEQARVPADCDQGGPVVVTGEQIWAYCRGQRRLWSDEGLIATPFPADGGLGASWHFDGTRQKVLSAEGDVLADLPVEVLPAVWTDRHLLAWSMSPEPGPGFVWADLTTGAVRRLDSKGSRLSPERVAMAPDGRTVALAIDQVVERFDLETGAWITDATLHTSQAQVQAVSPDGRRALTADHRRRILWGRDGAAVGLPDPTWPPRTSQGDDFGVSVGVGPGVPHSAAFSPDGTRLVSTFDGGVFTVHDGGTGGVLWQGNADPDSLDGPRYTFDVVPMYRGPGCMTGEKRHVSPPAFTPDGAFVVTAGRFEGKSLLLVWDTEGRDIVQRYVFDSGAWIHGFREDGRMVVLAGDALFALHAGRGDVDPELIRSNVQSAWMRDGRVEWLEVGADWRSVDVPRHRPEPRVVVEEGRAVFR